MGQFNLELGDTAAAINSFTDYLTLEKDDQDVLFALGVIYLEGGSFANNARALEIFESLTVTHEDFQAGWQNYGVALVRSGKTAEAKKALERAKALEGK
jgi:predicted Zn-dependent protease